MIKLKTLLIVVAGSGMIFSCGNKSSESDESQATESSESTETSPEATNTDSPSYDPNRGEGKFSSENLNLGASVDAAMAESGEKVAGVKCTSCHKITDEKLVGPGWKGVTSRRKPEWIMNFITNPDPMIDKDPAVQAQLELCLVRMPNQGLNETEARDILEFMRKNDAVK